MSDTPLLAEGTAPRVRIAIVGLVHDHARGFIPNALRSPDVELVGIVEPDQKLVARYAEKYQLKSSLFHPTLEALLSQANVEAVAVFTSTFDHRRVVEACAPRGLHVMMEKPLAVNWAHAEAMAAAARKGRIHLLVNYETTWYPAHHAAYKLVLGDQAVGEIRKVVVHDGHRGPKEIGCSPDFLNWLTDPVLNGGGALTDFGCYGADLMTWLMQGQRPTSVTAVTQHLKPEVYPKVDDEATIVLTYPRAQAIIQASWNWPYNRKDIEIYGQTGYVLVPRNNMLRVLNGTQPEQESTVAPLSGPESDPLAYLAAVVRGKLQPSGLSSLSVNLTVMEILDAARKSAATGKRIDLPPSKVSRR